MSHPCPAFRGLAGFNEVPALRPDRRRAARGLRRTDPSGLSENALDRSNGNPINRGDLGSRHAVFHPGADARKLRARDLGRRRHIRALHGKPGCLEKRCPSYGDQGFESIFLQRVGQGTLAFRAGVLGCVLVLCGANFRLNASTR